MATKEPRGGSRKAKSQDRHTTPKLQFHLPPPLREALERYRSLKKPTPTYTATMILALEELLRQEGLWPPPE